ncbi:MAG: hypothetical protein ACK4YU_03300 [Paracoccus sp. (in: a-proteobacteria)]
MADELDQVMRLLSARATEWLRQHVMDLPDPLPEDHAALPALALAARHAPALTGLMGRPSPVEVLMRRRLTSAHVQAAAQRHLAGRARPWDADLIAAGAMLAPGDPLWQLAHDDLAFDPAQPLARRLTLAPGPTLTPLAEAALLAPLPARVTVDALAARAETLMALWGYGAHVPRLSHPSRHGQILAQVRHWAVLASDLGCTSLLAQSVTCLRLIDPGHDVGALLSRLFPLQRPDGSFPPMLRQAEAPQDLSQATGPVLSVMLAMHVAVMRRWRGPHPAVEASRPLHGAMMQAGRHLAARVTACPPDEGWLRLRAATALTRALSQDWFARLAPPTIPLSDERLAQLARLAFRDAGTALRLRGHLGLARLSQPRAMRCDAPHLAWVSGAAVTLSASLPARIAADWNHAAATGDTVGFLALTEKAVLSAVTPSDCPRAAMARRLAASALADCLDDQLPLSDALDALSRLILLSLAFEDDPPMAQAA